MEGKVINGFKLISRLGVGGMAEVWYAENEIHLPAAVKVLNTMLSNSDQIVERFKQEAEIMVKLRHPNIRQVYGYGSIDGRPSIIMEYLEGMDLGQRLKRGERFRNEDLIRWWNQLVDALTYTHRKGIIHRDIKPGNIFVDVDGNIKLLDFGIAKIKESITMTRTGMMMGTLTYMSPEQVMDSKWVGPESDYYSLAVTFVHLMTGREPYDITTQTDYLIRRSIVETPLDLSMIPADWRAFLAPLLVKAPEKRGDLTHFQAGTSQYEGPATRPVNPAPKPQDDPTKKDEPKKKKKSHAGLWILLILLLAAGGALGYMYWPDPDTDAYEACNYVNDYRNYISSFGKNAKHYWEAKNFIDQHVADSTAKEEARRKAEAERRELEAYNNCTTIAACNTYLNDYPNGRYVSEVQSKKRALEEKKRQEEARKVAISVAYNRKVIISKGNLQYQASTGRWRFAEYQWSYIGSDNSHISSYYSGWIDLFGWGTGNAPTRLSQNSDDYQVFRDWGKNSISNGDGKSWRTLTKDEWVYMLNKRSTSSGIRYVKAEVNGVNGLIILPDNWNRSNYSLKNANVSDAEYDENVISKSNWTNKLEANGAVFLPAAGCNYEGSSINNVGSCGYYWTSTSSNYDEAYYSVFCESVLTADYSYNRSHGRSVRLVTDVK